LGRLTETENKDSLEAFWDAEKKKTKKVKTWNEDLKIGTYRRKWRHLKCVNTTRERPCVNIFSSH
jgi:hypothetical protein